MRLYLFNICTLSLWAFNNNRWSINFIYLFNNYFINACYVLHIMLDNRHIRVSYQFSRSVVSDSATPWIASCQASLSITNSWSLLKLMSIASVNCIGENSPCLPLWVREIKWRNEILGMRLVSHLNIIVIIIMKLICMRVLSDFSLSKKNCFFFLL